MQDLYSLPSFDEGGKESATSPTLSQILQVAREFVTCLLQVKEHRDFYLTHFWKILQRHGQQCNLTWLSGKAEWEQTVVG